MSFLLDTDTCSAFLKGDNQIWQRCMQHTGQLSISALVAAELYTWALRARGSPKRLSALTEFLQDVTVHDVTVEVARAFGALRAKLLDGGRPAPQIDLLIAATALVHNLTLVTHNMQDYEQVPDLRVVDWLAL